MDDGKILIESTAVSEYLDDAFPGDKLQPSDPYRKAQDRILLEQFGQFLKPYYSIFIYAGKDDSQEDIEARGDAVLVGFKYYENELAKRSGPFFGGDRPAIIDFFLWPHFERISIATSILPKVALTKSQFPKLSEWWENMTRVPAVKKEMFDPNWHVEVANLLKAGKPAGDHGLEN